MVSLDTTFTLIACIVLVAWVLIIVMARPSLEGLQLNTPTTSIQALIAQGGSLVGRTVAIVTMMRDPVDVRDWLNYHMLKGITRFYIRLETVQPDDAVARLLLSYPEVTLQIGDPTKTPDAADLELPGQQQMVRQREWVESAIRRAFHDGIDWIVHIDSDELIECGGLIGDAINADAKPHTQTLILQNHEALYDQSKIDDKSMGCFTSQRIVDCNTGHCASYANGKAVGRVTPFLHESGVHRFHYNGPGTDDDVAMTSAHLVHFESCDFTQYMQKFMKLAQTEVSRFPFPYYNDSIAVAKGPACQSADDASCRYEFASIYKRYRTTELD
ncbi:hypothetical protein TSOC_013546 [Tetrabaena socialis]|uniref:Uncharacterized protein n=1 Tax=Tetrabaena socialis TaxID=47790 RepID=A0A2J7ZK16_9CHLO|nr:hypothetical protein TSOC_013546 [Tetrabaena socialis]|eukprot:PNH00614.1 hypothetical protein TSOC_013546 [Tetrabaena socialis]